MNTFKGGAVVFLAACLLFVSGIGVAASNDPDMGLFYEFQLDQLLNPGAEQLQMEKEGTVFIYDGIKDSDIRLALDTQPQRMASMMFINVIWTDETGKPLTDPYTGEMVADDDC
jgi:hypothetical protein